MKQILRVALVVLLAAVTGVGSAWGEKKEYTDRNGVTWEYEEIVAGATCSIGIPKRNRGSISGFVKIPGTLEVDGECIKVVSIEWFAFEGCSSLTAVDIPSSVTEIGYSAFLDCIGLTSVTIPGSVTKIGESAFNNCIGLTSVTIPGSVTEIEESAFRNCIGLTSVTIPQGVTKIGYKAFYKCESLTAVTIPGSVTEIGEGAFMVCSGLKSIRVESVNKNYCAESGVLFTKDKATLICYPGGKPEESYTIPSSVTEIGRSAFENCSGLQAVTIPSSVTEIGLGAFSGCSGLTSVTIPGSVTEIGMHAFSGCSGLTSVTIPGSVTKIGWYAFNGCRGLTEVYWLAGRCAVEEKAFEDIDPSAILYVRQEEKKNLQTWWVAMKFFSAVKEGYVVTFKNSDGNELGEQLVKPSGTATAPTAPTKEGYIVEWQRDGKKYDFSTPVAQDITLVAVWKKKEKSTPSTPKDPKTAVESVLLAAARVVQNPIDNALVLEGISTAERIEVYSLTGVQTYAHALRGEERVEIATGSWASGIYVVRIIATDGEKTVRVVKR